MQQFYNLTKEVKMLVEEHERFRVTLKDVRSHEESRSTFDELDIDYEIIGLPQHRLISVKNIEPITIYIGEDDFLPVVKVRNDFPIVPHLNVLEDNITKTLCYSELTYEELKHRLSGRFLLTCIENWFLKTSMNKLHQQDQPMEPFFPYVNDYFIWDGIANEVDFEKYIVEEHGPRKLVYQSDAGDCFAVLNHEIPPDYSNLIQICHRP